MSLALKRVSSCPSKITLATTLKKRCGACGEFGHNRRTCTKPISLCLPCAPVSKSITTLKKCGACGELGHNRRTCTSTTTRPSAAPQVKEMTATQLFARLPNYIPYKTEKTDKTPEPLVGLKGCSLFREVKKPKSGLTPAEKRVAKTLASLLWGDSSVKKTTKIQKN